MNVFIRHEGGDAGLTPAFQINHPDEAHSIIHGLNRDGGVFLSAIGDHYNAISHQFVLGSDCEPFCEILLGEE